MLNQSSCMTMIFLNRSYNNPVKAGLCTLPEEYIYSSVRNYLEDNFSDGLLTHLEDRVVGCWPEKAQQRVALEVGLEWERQRGVKMVDKYEKLQSSKQNVNIALILTKECLLSLAKNKLFTILLSAPNSPFAKNLKRSFEKTTMYQIKRNIMTAFNCTATEADQILATIPKEITNAVLNQLKK